jgi:hypothetical protein
MSNVREVECNVAADQTYRVLVTVDAQRIGQLREVLTAIQPLSVVVTPGVSGNDPKQRVSYRGREHRLDRQVVRIEITCAERDVDWIVGAIDRVVSQHEALVRGEDPVVVVPIAFANA